MSCGCVDNHESSVTAEQGSQYEEDAASDKHDHAVHAYTIPVRVDRSSQHIHSTSEVSVHTHPPHDCCMETVPYVRHHLTEHGHSFEVGESETSLSTYSLRASSRGASEYAKACISFTRNLQQSLLLFNHEISNALQHSISGINDICLRVRDCLQEMDQQESLYETIKMNSNQMYDNHLVRTISDTNTDGLMSITDATFSKAPSAAVVQESNCVIKTAADDGVIVPVVTQSENQMRVVMNMSTGTINGLRSDSIPSGKALVVSDAEGGCFVEQMQAEFNQCLELIKSNIESASVALINNKEPVIIKPVRKTFNNVPRKLRKLNPYREQLMKQAAEKEKNKDTTLSKDAIVDKSRATQDLHEKLLKQLEASDSFFEFEKYLMKNPQIFKGNLDDENAAAGDQACETAPAEKTPKPPSKETIPAALPGKTTSKKHGKTKTARSRTINLKKYRKQAEKSPKDTRTNSTTCSKYVDSLFFKSAKAPQQTPPTKDVPSAEKPTSPTTTTTKGGHRIMVENVGRSLFKGWSLERYRHHLLRLSSLNLKRQNRLSCVDILDELSVKDLEPILSEYPRKDNYTKTHNVVNILLDSSDSDVVADDKCVDL